MMRQTFLTVQMRRPLTREELKRRRRWQIAENMVTILLGLSFCLVLFWAGWLVGSGAFS